MNDRGMPVGWIPNKRVKKEDSDKVEIRLDREEVHSGGVSAYIKRTWDEEKLRSSGWVQYLELAPNTTYKAGCWLKTNISNGVCSVLYIGMTTESRGCDKSLRSLRGTTPWTYYEFTFTTPQEPIKRKGCYIYPALFAGRGKVWIDDVKIVVSSDVI